MEDFGFKKIDLSNEKMSPPPSQESSAKANVVTQSGKVRFFKTRNGKTLLTVLIILSVLLGFLFWRGIIIYSAVRAARAHAKDALSAIKKQNIVQAHDKLIETKKSVEHLKSAMAPTAFLAYVPPFGGYYADGEHLVDATLHGVNGAIITTESLIPYADVLGLKGQKSFVGGSAEERIKLAVKSMGKIVPRIDDIERELEIAKADVDKVDSGRYPNFLILKKVRAQVDQIKALTDDGVVAVRQGKPLIKVLPQLLGDGGQKKYLILFQNDKELRPTGGFITFYSVFRVDEGVIRVEGSSDIYNLDNSISYHPAAPPIIAKYLPKVPTFNIRDSNLSPDFQVSMNEFRKFYDKSSSKTNIDGIIALDTSVLVHILDILGEVQASGVTYNTKIDSRCNCPQVIYLLEAQADQPVGHARSERKFAIGDLLYAIMQKALSSSPKLYWGPLFQREFQDIAEKHILFSLNDTDAQKGVESLNWGGQIKPFDGDYLHINDSNFGGAKANMYTTQSVRVDYTRDASGEITKKLTVNYKNPYPGSDCNLERGGLCLNATLRDFVRVYVPRASILTESHGSEVKVTTTEDLGKTSFEGFITVNPLGKSQFTYTYKLPFKLKSGSSLPVLIQKQPGTNDTLYEIYVNGRKAESFKLTTDKQFSLKI